jgi:hypothetical protein
LEEGNNNFSAFFPPKIYAIAVPCSLLVIVLSIVGVFVGVTLVKESKKRK